jgi:hypothetical protein
MLNDTQLLIEDSCWSQARGAVGDTFLVCFPDSSHVNLPGSVSIGGLSTSSANRFFVADLNR